MSAVTSSNVFVPEIVIGVPHDSDDLYLRHQQVWQGMHGIARKTGHADGVGGRGAEFLYAQIHPRLYLVRSRHLDASLGAKKAVMPSTGQKVRFMLDLVAMRGTLHDQPVPEVELHDWAQARIEANGWTCNEVQVESAGRRLGRKHNMRIDLQVVSLRGVLSIADQSRSAASFVSGIGRGRRFGFGMLRLA